MRSKVPNTKPTRGVRDPKLCKVQTGGRLTWNRTVPGVLGLETLTPEAWTDRPVKFPGHIRLLLRKPGTTITDIKWKQLGSETWWRIPDWPDGNAAS